MKHCARFILFLAVAACSNSSSSSSGKPSEPKSQPTQADTADQAREHSLAELVGQLLQTQHLRRHTLDDEVSRKAFDTYLDQLDAGKLFLLQSHADQLRVHADRIDDEMAAGRLTLAHAGADLMAERIEVVQKLVAAQVAKPFDLTDDESIETDSDKRGFCKTEAELAERWRQVLEYDVLTRVARMEERAKALAEGEPDDADHSGAAGVGGAANDNAADIPDTFAGREKKAREDVGKAYAARFARRVQTEPIDQLALYLNAVAGVYDPHTSYLPPVTKENFDIRMSGSLEGIGALLREDEHYIRVDEIVPGSASWRQGDLEAGDLITAVAQDGQEPVDVADMRIDKVVQMIRGPKGTVVALTVQKPNREIQVISITRDVVKIETAYARGAILRHKKLRRPVGYIYLPSFYGNTREDRGETPDRRCTEDVRRLLALFVDRGIDSAVLDLRGNGGGLLYDAQDMSGLFIERGPIVQTRSADGEREVLEDKDPSVAFRGQLVIMVDRFSASAAEILAAALQDYGRAVVVGTSATHGKGTVQVLLSLDALAERGPDELELGVIKLTRQQFYRVTGGSTQLRGVVPDVTLPDPDSYIESGERYLDHAIPYSEVEPLSFEPWPKQGWDKATLAARSVARQAVNPVFAKVEKRTALIEARRDQTIEPLSYDKWTAKRERERAALDAVSLDVSKQPARFQLEPLVYDGNAKPKPKRRPGRNTGNDDTDRWQRNLARDPWLEEALRILGDMTAAASAR